MRVFRGVILVMVLALLIGCGMPQEPENWKLEKAEFVKSIENMKIQNEYYKGIVNRFPFPEVTLDYYFKLKCSAYPYETSTSVFKAVRFINNTDADATFTFPNPIFVKNTFVVPAHGQKVVALSKDASNYPETDYAVEAQGYQEPAPGPWILIPGDVE